MKSERLFEVAEKLYVLEQASDQFGPMFAETVDALADDLTSTLDHTLSRWQRTLERALSGNSTDEPLMRESIERLRVPGHG